MVEPLAGRCDSMMTRRDVVKLGVGAVAAVGSAAAVGCLAATGDEQPSQIDDSLRDIAQRNGLDFGSMVLAPTLRADAALRARIIEECSVIVPGVSMKWGQTEPSEGHFSYGDAEYIAGFARSYGLRLRGHTAFWYRNIPDWAKSALLSEGPQQVVSKRISDVVSHFRGRVAEWDVVNEAIEPKDGNNGMLRTAPFARPQPYSFFADCFHVARQADKQSLLFYNEYGLEADTPDADMRRRGTLQLLENMVKAGAPIDGLGSQTHLTLGQPFDSRKYRDFLKEVAALGLVIRITEFDVDDHRAIPVPSIDDRQVADYASKVLDVCFDEPAVKGMLTWGLSDKESWLQNEKWARKVGGIAPRPLPYDTDFARKPLWYAIANSLKNAPARESLVRRKMADRS